MMALSPAVLAAAGMGIASVSSDSGKASDHLANERTFLAWIRTSISIIVFGFVVAKFGITLRQLLRLQNQAAQNGALSLGIGIGFMMMGVLMAFVAMIRYHLTLRRLEAGQFKPARGIIVFLGVLTAVFGFILIVYLAFTARSF
jgi:putative membrane protein